MAAKQYELGSNVLDWYRDFCPGNSFQVVIRPDITFADVVVGMANGVDLNNLIGSDSEIFGNIVVAKLAEITGESYETVSNVWHEAPMNSDYIGEDERRLIEAAKLVIEPRSRRITTVDIDFGKAFSIANHAMLNEIMPSFDDPALYGIAERVLPNLEWRTDSIAIDAINELCCDRYAEHYDLEAVRSHATELFAACQVQLAFIQADLVFQALDWTIPATDRVHFVSVYTSDPYSRRYISTCCLGAFSHPRFTVAREAVADIEKRSNAKNSPTNIAEAGELIANAKEDGISVGINIPGGKCADIAFVDADPGADDLYPTPVRAFTYNGRDEEPDHRTDVHLDGDMVLDGQMTAETPAHVPADITAAAKEAAAKSVKPDTVGTDGIKH